MYRVDPGDTMVGVVPWSHVFEALEDPTCRVADVMLGSVELAHPDEILCSVADRMAHEGIGVLPVVERSDRTHVVGLITQFDLLQARQRLLEEERLAQRVLTLRRADLPTSEPDGDNPAAPGVA